MGHHHQQRVEMWTGYPLSRTLKGRDGSLTSARVGVVVEQFRK